MGNKQKHKNYISYVDLLFSCSSVRCSFEALLTVDGIFVSMTTWKHAYTFAYSAHCSITKQSMAFRRMNEKRLEVCIRLTGSFSFMDSYLRVSAKYAARSRSTVTEAGQRLRAALSAAGARGWLREQLVSHVRQTQLFVHTRLGYRQSRSQQVSSVNSIPFCVGGSCAFAVPLSKCVAFVRAR